MQTDSINLFQGFLLGTVLILIFVAAIITFVVVYNLRLSRQQQKMLQMEADFQREMLEATVESQEKERERIARDLHDEIGAMLSTISLSLLRMGKKTDPDSPVKQIAQNLGEIVASTNEQVRKISQNLMPPTLQRFGLALTIKDFFDTVAKQTGLQMTFQAPENFPRMASEMELGIFRIVQEGVNNSLKHAEAKSMQFEIREKGDEWEMNFRDDGKGFLLDEAFANRSLGLKNITSRATLLGGRANIDSAPGKGTRILLAFPKEKMPAVLSENNS